MKHKWLIFLFLGVFVIAVAAGLTIRSALNAPPKEAAAELTTAPPVTEPPDPNAPKFTVSPPETEPPETLDPVFSEPDILGGQTAPAETAEPVSSEAEEDSGDGIINLCIGGDTSIDGEFADFARGRTPDYPWEEIMDVMHGADISVVNLETCVSDRGTSEKREGYGFQTPPEMLEGFSHAGIDAVNLANNHVRDFGYDALLDTFSNLRDSGIGYFGAGRDIDEAQELFTVEREGITVGFVGANRIFVSSDCSAAEGHAGVNQIGDPDDQSTKAFIERLYEYDSLCDVLVVFLHAGTEEVFEVTSYQKEMARKFIDAGADIVVGGHSHTLQPVEFYAGKPIIYSIGNLIFWHIDDDIDGLAAIFDITLTKNGFKSLKLHPVFIKNYKANYLTEGEGNYPLRYRQIIDLMNGICEPYGTGFDSSGEMYVLE